MMSPEPVVQVEGDIVGTWRLVSWELRDATGEVTYPLGRDANGRIIYTPDGSMSVLITARGRKPYTSGDMFGGSVEEMASAAGSSIAYFGTYEVRGDTVIHHVELSAFPNWESTMQERLVSWQGGKLILRTRPIFVSGQEQEAVLVWERMET